MHRYLFRWIWRIITILSVVGLAALTSYFLIPFLDQRLPVFPTLLLTYAAIAYVVLPIRARFWKILTRPDHIPLYTVTGDGIPADPVNIAVIAHSRRHFIKTVEAAGWYKADKNTFRNGLRELLAIIFDTPYPRAPFSRLYLFGRAFEIGFQKPSRPSMSPRERHHVRFWQLQAPANPKHAHNFWWKHVKHLFSRKQKIWIGAAIDDTGLSIRWHDFQITHKNDTDTNAERDLFVSDLDALNLVKKVSVVGPGEKYEFRGQTIGNYFFCDGYIKVVELANLPRLRAKATKLAKSAVDDAEKTSAKNRV